MLKGSKGSILLVDDDLAFRMGTLAFLEDHGFAATVATNGEDARRELANKEYDLVLSDLVMPDINGIELLKHIGENYPGLTVIMVTGFASIGTAVEAMRLGARDYVTKPCDNDELLIKIQRALDERKKDRELQELREELRGAVSVGNMISNSAAMKHVFEQIRQVADTDVTVLIQGESGTGKELVARALHFNSRRRTNPFIAVNCSAIPESLLESELFGHEKGAFTGAARQRAGKFEEASTGTLFLDEIGDTPTSVQTKLLRVLQEKTIERIGGEGSITVETRVVVATNRNLEVMMLQGDFREDLFYRLNIFPIMIPPLRERLEDIPILAEYFVKRHSDLGNGRVQFIAPSIISAMMGYHWRGNVRELENLIKRAIIKTTGDTITSLELPASPGSPHPEPAERDSPVDLTTPYKEYLSTIVRHAEESYLLRMLRLHRGNINQIAKLMDVDRKTIYRKMDEYGINPASFRD
jgi:two-component system response regulator AtoC